MGLIELLLIAVGLSMDAFAVAVCTGLTMPKVTIKKSLIVGLYFGIFQAVMPLTGYMLATRFADKVTSFAHWITFVLLCLIGGKMVMENFKKDTYSDIECLSNTCKDGESSGSNPACNEEASLGPAKMLPLALATSIDALAVGVSFAFLKVTIIPAVFSIGITTLVLSMFGVKVGNVLGTKFKNQAGFAGGMILMLMGLKILLEHMGIINP